MKYGIIHNNFFYFYNPVKADGTRLKTAYVKKIWTPLGRGDDKCIAFNTREEAEASAEDQYYNPQSWIVVETEDDGTIIPCPEVDKLNLGYRPTKAEEGEKAD